MFEYWKRLTLRQGFVMTLVFAAVITLAALNVRELQSGDETRVAGIAAKMYVGKNYLIPYLNHEPFLEYPPLYYWATAGSYAVFGINDFAAKLPSALAAMGCGLLLFAFAGKLRFPPWCALLSSLMLMTSAQFFGNSRKCMVDMVLAFFILLAVFSFYALTVSENRRSKLGYFVLFVAGLTGGIYTKGLLGLFLPGLVLGVWLVLGDVFERKISWFRYLLLGSGGLLTVFFAAIWYYLIFRTGDRKMLETALFVNNFGRFSGSQGDHLEPFYYYFTKLPSLFLPWLPILPFALWQSGKDLRKTPDRGTLLLIVFLAAPFTVLCISSSKRIVYLLPLYAPCALLCGYYLLHLPPKVKEILEKGLRKVPRALCPDTSAKAWSYCLIIAFLFVLFDVVYAVFTNPKESLRPLFEKCAALEKKGKKVFLMDVPERTSGAAYFYLHKEMEEIPVRTGTPPAGEYWILRDKRGTTTGQPFADHHKLVGKE